jgi:hypothetical protein
MLKPRTKIASTSGFDPFSNSFPSNAHLPRGCYKPQSLDLMDVITVSTDSPRSSQQQGLELLFRAKYQDQCQVLIVAVVAVHIRDRYPSFLDLPLG